MLRLKKSATLILQLVVVGRGDWSNQESLEPQVEQDRKLMLESGLGTAIRKSGFTLKYFILKGQLLLPVLTGLSPKNGIWVAFAGCLIFSDEKDKEILGDQPTKSKPR